MSTTPVFTEEEIKNIEDIKKLKEVLKKMIKIVDELNIPFPVGGPPMYGSPKTQVEIVRKSINAIDRFLNLLNDPEKVLNEAAEKLGQERGKDDVEIIKQIAGGIKMVSINAYELGRLVDERLIEKLNVLLEKNDKPRIPSDMEERLRELLQEKRELKPSEICGDMERLAVRKLKDTCNLPLEEVSEKPSESPNL